MILCGKCCYKVIRKKEIIIIKMDERFEQIIYKRRKYKWLLNILMIFNFISILYS